LEHNPYKAPNAVVADGDGESAIETPAIVVRAIILMILSLALNFGILVLDWRYIGSRLSPVALASGEVFAVAITGWLAWKIAAGRNWARITLLVLTVVSLPQAGLEVLNAAPRAPYIAALKLIELGLDVGVLYLLFFPGREFFRKKPSQAN
jgi:hypothetical protein